MYQRLSRCRSELMGLAALWVMLFHAYAFKFGFFPLDAFKQLGFAGVDIFILLSAMGLYVSLSRTEKPSLTQFYLRRVRRVLPTFWLVVGVYSLYLVLQGRIGWRVLVWNLSTLYYWFHIDDAFNWYIPAVLVFYVLAPLYAKLLRRCRFPGWLTAAMFPISYGIYRLSIPVHLNYTEDFICRIPAFALGMYAGYQLSTNQVPPPAKTMPDRRECRWLGDYRPAPAESALYLSLLPHRRTAFTGYAPAGMAHGAFSRPFASGFAADR